LQHVSPNLFGEKRNTVILKNFEYKNNHHDFSSYKLRLLEKLLSEGRHIIVNSEVEPTEYADMYHQATLTKKQNSEGQPVEDISKLWRQILGQFIQVYKPFKHCKDIDSENKTLISELKHGTFLPELADYMNKKIKQNDNLDDDDIILEIQQLAKSYYYSLWNALTVAEHIAVHDIAKDGFVNIKNKPVIDALLKKKLLCYNKDKLELMNKSFTNFVLSGLSRQDIRSMDRVVMKKGKWVNIRLAIVLVILALIVLIGIGKPGFFKNIKTVMIALAGAASVIPTVTRVFSFAQFMKQS